MSIFVLKPHKSIDKIQEEYNVEFSRDDLDTLVEITVKCSEIDNYEPLALACLMLAKKYKVPDDKTMDFANDLFRTITFYIRAIKKIDEMIGEGGGK